MYEKITFISIAAAVILCLGYQEAQSRVLQPQEIICTQKEDREYCTSMSGQALNGKIAVKREDGTISGVSEFKKGYRNGYSVFLNYRGDIVQSVMFKDGIQDGITLFYHDNRKVWIAAPYTQGLLEGTVAVYTDAGKQRGRFVYHKGELKNGYCRLKHGHRILYPNRQSEVGFNQLVSCGKK
jgi:antitoxin component YwqK of YwqJK toxin-antitoxin module